jgi:2-polyprenyl-6-methoxyphenol hydroxylase-like FAD-dependent oxidoreductase
LNSTVVWDGNTNELCQKNEDDKFSHRPEIDRQKVKDILLERLDAKSICYGKTLKQVVAGSLPDTWDLHFGDGSVETGFGLVVGAEGAWSCVCKLVTDVCPYYSGITGIELQAVDVAKTNPWRDAYVGRGSLFSFGEGRTLQIQRMGDGSIRTYACLRQPEKFVDECGIDWSQPDTARKQLVERYYNDCDLKRLILENKDGLNPRPLFMLPIGMK